MYNFKVLIVDDSISFTDSITHLLSELGCKVANTSTIKGGRSTILGEHYDLYLLDLSLPDGNGDELIGLIRDQNPTGLIAILTNLKPSISVLSGILRSGASDYILKTEVEHRLQIILERVKERKRNSKTSSISFSHQAINIGNSKAIQALKSEIKALANSQINVILYGETGSGKEIAAQSFSSYNRDPARPFVAVNLAAIPENLIESELFGHVKGAFTSAISDRPGLLELANGGDLFLDELGEIPIQIQPKLLRVLQTGEFSRIGSNKVIKTNIRVISATNRDLKELITIGKFRADLYYRLAGHEIRVPSLEDRAGDIPDLISFIIKNSGSPHLEISSQAVSYLMSQSWPGNIRELEHRLTMAIHLSSMRQSSCIDSEDLLPNTVISINSSNKRIPSKKFDLSKSGYSSYMRENEKEYIEFLLESCQGSVCAAAKKIGMSQSVLYSRIANLGVRRE